jgi:O6-methylguanine-DNA--protein-cysteine methyltransferase
MKTRFTHRGREFEMEQQDFVKAVKEIKPGKVTKYSVVINDIRYPIRQVVAAATRLPVIEFTSSDAYRILRKFGFSIDVDG